MLLKIENSWFDSKEIIAIEFIALRNYRVILRDGYGVLVQLSQEAVDIYIRQIQARRSSFIKLGHSWFHIKEIVAIEQAKEGEYWIIIRGYGGSQVFLTTEMMNAKAQELVQLLFAQ